MELFMRLMTDYSFPVEIITASLFFAHYFRRRSGWPLIIAVGTAVIFTVSTLWRQDFTLHGMFSLTAKYIVLYLLTVILMHSAFTCGWWGAVYCATAGYCVQHLTYNSFRLVLNAVSIDAVDFADLLHLGWFAGTYVLLLTGIELIYSENQSFLNGKLAVDRMSVFFSAVFLLSATLLDNYAMLTLANRGAYDLVYLVNIFLVVIAAAILYIQIASVSMRRKEQDLARMQLLLHTQEKTYARNREMIESINLKAHDLKHQLLAMRERISVQEAENMERLLTMYDATLHSGCEALDVVLAEKGLHCLNGGIRFTCLLDGEHLRRFSDTDIYSFFGNAIDNAIDAVEPLPEEKRIISITENLRTSLLNIRIENYCLEENVTLKHGLPVTRRDERYHGFGAKSMGLIAEKYNGTVLFSCFDGKFIVDLMLPL